jgi:rubrerythrin
MQQSELRHDLVIMTRDVADPDLSTLDALDGRPAAWRCTACGVVTHSSDPPNHCPDCGAGAGFLLRVDEE